MGDEFFCLGRDREGIAELEAGYREKDEGWKHEDQSGKAHGAPGWVRELVDQNRDRNKRDKNDKDNAAVQGHWLIPRERSAVGE